MCCIYSIELQIKLTNNNTAMSASLLVLHLDTDTESLLRARMYDKRLFITPNVSFSFIFAYEVYIYQLIRYSRSCSFF